MSENPTSSGALASSAPQLSTADRLRKIHPLLATAAVAVTAVSVIAAVQFLAPQGARSATDPNAATSASRVAGARAPGAPVAGAPPPPAAVVTCADCGEVVNIRTIRQEGSGSGLGAAAGGVLGGVLGHQAGAGRGKEALTVLGVVGGAVAGNEVEKQAKAQTRYLVDVRMSDGSARTVTETAPPSLAIGAKVRVSGNTIALR